MKRNAKSALNLPHNKRSGTRKNSRLFMAAITIIWVTAFNLVRIPLIIQMAIKVSESPINNVNSRE